MSRGFSTSRFATAGILLALLQGEALAESMRHRSATSKGAAPTQEDHASYFSTFEQATPEKMRMADDLRLKTIASIEKLLNGSKNNKLRQFELYLRLGEIHAERHDYLRDVEIRDFEKAWDEWNKGGKKGKEPKLDTSGSKAELLKCASTYRKLVTTYPNDARTDAALYELGKTLGRLNNDNAVLYFNQLIKSFPQSQYIASAHLALGEFYFDQHDVPKAMAAYKEAMKYKNDRAYPYAVYKLGWAYYNASAKDSKEYQDNTRKSLAAFKLVVRIAEESKSEVVTRLNLKEEATKDLIMVWADTEGIDEAWDYFSKRNDKESFYSVLERLGNTYVEQGKNAQAIEVYTRLTRESPTRGSNPQIYAALARLYDEQNNQAKVVETIATMNRLFVAESNWTRANSAKKDEVAEARTLSERNTHRYGALFHQRGQKQKKDEFLEAAAKIYAIYLESFKDNENAYEIRFYLADIHYHFKRYMDAANEYTKVAEAQPQGKYLKDAAYNAVSAVNDLDGTQKYEKLPPVGKVTQPIELPKVKQALVKVMDNFVRLLPKDPAGLPMRFTVAQTYFAYGHYDVALKRFEDIGTQFPSSKQGQTALRIILTLHTEKKDWDKLIAACRKYLQNNQVANSELKTVVIANLKNGTFQKAMALEKASKHGPASELFLSYQREFPDDANADRALYNASLNFYKVAKVDDALKAGALLLKTYPKSELISAVSLDMAQAYEALADFANAAKHYRDFALKYPSDKSASRALYNAATLYKGLNQLDESAKHFERFTQLYPKNDLIPDAWKELATIHEKTKNYNEAVKAYDRFASATKDTNDNLFAKAKIAQIHQRFLNKEYGQKELKNLERMFLAKDGPAALEARNIVASMVFEALEDDFRRFKDMKVKSAESLQKDVKKKQESLVYLAGRYEKLIDLGSGEFVVAALYRLGEMHENFAQDLFQAPAPKGANQVEIDNYKSSIEKVAFPLKEESGKFFETAYRRSVEVQTFSEWTKRAYDKMVELNPDKHPDVIEKSAEPSYMSHRMEWEDAISKLVE